MKSKQSLLLACCLALLGLLAMAGAAMADEYSQSTKLTFSAPVEIPGQVLTAGTYWFTLMDSPSDRDIVQIWNEDRSQLVATVLAIPDYRLQPADKTIITFDERPADQPEAIQAWFYPGENFGHEFLYPNTRAVPLPYNTHHPLLSTPHETAA